MWQTLFVILLLVAGVYFVGRLLFVVIRMTRVVRDASKRAHAALEQELAGLTTEEIRTRLLRESYFTDALRGQPSIAQFLSRVERGDEIVLAAEYPRGTLYRMLADAEQALGRRGRPEAVDAIRTINALLSELARRSSNGDR